MWARKRASDAMCGENRAQGEVDELVAVITLHAFSENIKLSFNEGEKALQVSGGIRFVA